MSEAHSQENKPQDKNQFALKAINLCQSFEDASGVLEVLRHVDLEVKKGEFVSIVGASGSGKSSLMHLLGGLENPTLGTVTLNGQDYSKLNPDQRARYRGKHLGFVYQLHHLLPEFTALENVAMPLRLRKVPRKIAHERAEHWLQQVGLSARLSHRPPELSGGERQRVAIARAMVSQPAAILADEPTGNLDEETARFVQDLMFKLNQEQGISFVVVTHDKDFAQRAQSVYQMHLGKLHAGFESLA